MMPDVAFVELPPRKLFLSSSITRPPRSRTVCAAERPERPPPTTITCAMVTGSAAKGLVGTNAISDPRLRTRPSIREDFTPREANWRGQKSDGRQEKRELQARKQKHWLVLLFCRRQRFDNKCYLFSVQEFFPSSMRCALAPAARFAARTSVRPAQVLRLPARRGYAINGTRSTLLACQTAL